MSEPQLPQSLLRVLVPLTEWFKDQHVSYAIIGGAAIGFLAQPRATQDIDAVTWLDLAETATFVASGARFGFFSRISDPIEFGEMCRTRNGLRSAKMLNVTGCIVAWPVS